MPDKLKAAIKSLIRLRSCVEKSIVNFVDSQHKMREIMMSLESIAQTVSSQILTTAPVPLQQLQAKCNSVEVCGKYVETTKDTD
jgi:hypothetical protein